MRLPPRPHARAAVLQTESAESVEAAERSMIQTSETTGRICTSVTATTVDGMLKEIGEAAALQADLVELRLDFLQDLSEPEAALTTLLKACNAANLPSVATYRPNWEGCATCWVI